MATFTCLIAEDNPIDRDALELHLRKIPNLQIKAVCGSGVEAASLLQKLDVDMVFSDVDMPGLTGLELVKSLSRSPVFIFISSYAEYAAESYTLDVVDFVTKPATFARLLKSFTKAIDYIELKKLLAEKKDNTQPLAPASTSDFFYIKENGSYTKIDYANLLFAESMGNFSQLYTTGPKKHLTLISLKNVEEQLPKQDFLRVHKQYIVNLRHITAVTADGEVKLNGGQSVTVGQQYRATLMEFVNNKLLQR